MKPALWGEENFLWVPSSPKGFFIKDRKFLYQNLIGKENQNKRIIFLYKIMLISIDKVFLMLHFIRKYFFYFLKSVYIFLPNLLSPFSDGRYNRED